MFEKLIQAARVKSPWVLHFDCGSCNGCDIETLACLTPVYDIERFGGINVGNPKHADVLIVTGTVNHRNKKALRTLWEQMPDPKVVVAVRGVRPHRRRVILRDAYNVVGRSGQGDPGDVYVPGCPAKPEAIIDGLVLGPWQTPESGDTASARAKAAPPATAEQPDEANDA